MNDYVSKPIDPELLFATLTRWLAGSNQVTDAKAAPAILDVLAIVGVNTQSGLSRVAGNSALYGSLLREFASRQQETASELVVACDGKDLALIGQLCHRLQGVASNLGIDQLCQRVVEMSTLVKLGGDPDLGLPGLLAELHRVSQQILALDKLPESLQPDAEPLNLEAECDALSNFAEQLRLLDGCAPDALPGIRHLLLKRGHSRAEVYRLSRSVSQYRYGEARLFLQDLMTDSADGSLFS
jgi:HPt (histidine-containing phosphotransfer) domain-containing protein